MKKRLFITGGSQGIGKACVEEFCRKGWQVTFTYRNSPQAALALQEQWGAVPVYCDLADPQALEKALEPLGIFDAVVLNAAQSQYGLFQDLSGSKLQELFQVNVLSGYRVLSRLCPSMLSQGGAVVTVASMWGQCGASCEVAYSATKGALIALTKALAAELAPSGIRVNAVSPGVVDTAMNGRFSPQERKELAAQIPLGRFATPQEIAATVFFLAGEDASYLTGQVLCPNGGQVMGQ